MSRNTQFAKFAELLFADLPWSEINIDMDEDGWEERWKKRIAQRAYDLVGHALDHAFTHNIVFDTREDATNQIPDLTEMPEVSQ